MNRYRAALLFSARPRLRTGRGASRVLRLAAWLALTVVTNVFAQPAISASASLQALIDNAAEPGGSLSQIKQSQGDGATGTTNIGSQTYRGTSAVTKTANTNATQSLSAAAIRGLYLARMGDCTSCHSVAGASLPFGGGLVINSPFGPIYSSNITPDPDAGIGRYSFADFKRALTEGVTPDGTHLYPAMPYPSFSKMSDADLSDLYVFFREGVAPVSTHPPQTRLPFPFNQRWGLIFWNWIFAPARSFKSVPERSAQWNRGAYLVEGAAHCGACHTPRGPAFEERGYTEGSSRYLAGATLDNWYAGNLRADRTTGLGRWSEADLEQFLGTGHGRGMIAFGNMAQVVENSSQYFTDADRVAIAVFVKSIPALSPSVATPANPQPYSTRISRAVPEGEHPGAGLYGNYCSKCHEADGSGQLGKYPALAGNPMVNSEPITSLLRVILEGGKNPQTLAGPKPKEMPSFAPKLNDQEIADVTNYIRQAWGNHAPAAPSRDVTLLREALRD